MIGNARDITTLLDLEKRNTEADEELFRLVKQRFHALAGSLMWKERPENSVQATMLVDDAFMQLIRRSHEWTNREDFFRRSRQDDASFAHRLRTIPKG